MPDSIQPRNIGTPPPPPSRPRRGSSPTIPSEVAFPTQARDAAGSTSTLVNSLQGLALGDLPSFGDFESPRTEFINALSRLEGLFARVRSPDISPETSQAPAPASPAANVSLPILQGLLSGNDDLRRRWNNLRLAPNIGQEVEENLSQINSTLINSPFSRTSLLTLFIMRGEVEISGGNRVFPEAEQDSNPGTSLANVLAGHLDLAQRWNNLQLSLRIRNHLESRLASLFEPECKHALIAFIKEKEQEIRENAAATFGLDDELERLEAILRRLPRPAGVFPEAEQNSNPGTFFANVLAGNLELTQRWNNLSLPLILSDRMENRLKELSVPNREKAVMAFIRQQEQENREGAAATRAS